MDDNNAIFVTDNTPNAEGQYRARFYIDPNSIAMVSGNSHFIFQGYSGSTIVFGIEFRFYKGSYQVRTGLLNDSAAWKNNAWLTISDAPHYVEIDWQAATTAGSKNGSLTIWIDGVQKASTTGIDNDTRRLDQVRLGAIAGIDSGTRGTYYFDEFESRNQTYIGP